MSDHSTDAQFLRHALDLAQQGFALASPNPYVGAVIVNPDGAIVGTGVYTYDGLQHAEIRALDRAGDRARGGTLYINLEPHAHQGRTPPCTDALIASGVHRVIASMTDPNPEVSGRGFDKLRAAGIQVEIGLLAGEARELNESFACYIRRGVPFVTLKSAMTLDGKIAPPPSPSLPREAGAPSGGWITGEAARDHVHKQRHRSDAILTGVGTILADDPLLTDRSGNPRRRPLLRVILDSRLRLPLQSRLVQSAAATRKNNVLLFHSFGEEKKKHELEARGVRVEHIPPGKDARPNFDAIMRRLGQLEITSLMIEGGAAINSAALSAGVVDKFFLYYAPKIMAARGAVPFASGASFQQASASPDAGQLRIKNLRLHRFGDDFAAEGYLRDPYED